MNPREEQAQSPLSKILEMLLADNSKAREADRTAGLRRSLPSVMRQAEQLGTMPQQEQRYWTSPARAPEYWDTPVENGLTLRQANPWAQRLNQKRNELTEARKFAQQEGAGMAPPDIEPEDLLQLVSKFGKIAAGGLAGGLPLAAGMLRYGREVRPNDFLFRVMRPAELSKITNARNAGLPYELSGSVVNPNYQGAFRDMGIVFDVNSAKPWRLAAPRDAFTMYDEWGPGRTLARHKWAGDTLPNSLDDLYRQQQTLRKGGDRLADYNEAVLDFAHPDVVPRGVFLPRERPTIPALAERWDELAAVAKRNQWGTFWR